MYGLTTFACLAVAPILWLFRALSIMRTVVLLFILDSILTLEAAFYSDVVSIAILHIVTVPAFIGLIYLDLLSHHKREFSCFLCARQISGEEEIQSVTRNVDGKQVAINVHATCLVSSEKERRAISERTFRRGIPK